MNIHHQHLPFVQKRLKSFKYAFRGLVTLIKIETNARLHLLVTVLVLAISIFFKLNTFEWCMIVICIAVVWTAEAFNTSIEKIADHVSPTYHRHIKRIKDLSAAGVLFCTIAAVVIGLVIFTPKVIAFLKLLDIIKD